MTPNALSIEVTPVAELSAAQKAEIIALCAAAYEENFDRLFELLPGSTHVLARLNGTLVSHVAWIARQLQPEGLAPLRTAYVEAVATAPEWQGRGFATAALKETAARIGDYDLGALSPSEAAFYERLGWELWRGPLAVRTEDGLSPTPDDEEVMILRLPRTPPLDVTARLTAEWREGDVW
jgi:aminoglycoside 2'-N-acetyltransferase I